MQRNKQTKYTITTLGLAIALTTLTACPPEEDAEQPDQAQPQTFDIADYWPFELGNYWEFINTDGFTDGFLFTRLVVKDYSTKDISAWGILHESFDPNGNATFEAIYYYVLRKDFLVRTEHKDAMLEMVQNPEGPIPTNLFVQLIAPRLVKGDSELQHYEGSRYALAGPLAEMEDFVDCGQPHDPLGAPELDAIATLSDGVCHTNGEPDGLITRDVFVRGIGLVASNHLRLVYAVVGNTEYNFAS